MLLEVGALFGAADPNRVKLEPFDIHLAGIRDDIRTVVQKATLKIFCPGWWHRPLVHPSTWRQRQVDL